MAVKPRTITIVLFLLVFASATSAMQTEGTEYQDSEFFEEFSGYATEAWNNVTPSLEPLVELWCAQATNNDTSFAHLNPIPSAAPRRASEPYRSAIDHVPQSPFLPLAASEAELGYQSQGAPYLSPHAYPQPSTSAPAESFTHQAGWSMPYFEAQPSLYPGLDTQNWIRDAYTPGDRVQPAVGPSANWSGLVQFSPGQSLLQAQPPTPATPSTPFTSISGEPLVQLADPFAAPAPFACDHPGCRFTSQTAQSLRHHQRYHVPEAQRPHPCPQCPRRFHCPREVERHRITHSLERRYFCAETSCLYATKGFGRKDHLTRHNRAKHPVAVASQTADTCSSMGDHSVD